MEIEIRPADGKTIAFVNQFDKSFVVDSRLELSMRTGTMSYEVVSIPKFIKTYPSDDTNYQTFLDQPDKAIYFAHVGEQPVGQIILTESWNRYGYIRDLSVNSNFRKRGVGTALMEQAIGWAQARALPGLMLETQDINVPACKLYERMGFQLSGFDRALYNPVLPGSSEIALYWYLLF